MRLLGECRCDGFGFGGVGGVEVYDDDRVGLDSVLELVLAICLLVNGDEGWITGSLRSDVVHHFD